MTDQKPEELPIIRMQLENAKGEPLGAPIVMACPKQLSFRIAKLYLLEYSSKELKQRFDVALKALGFK